MMLMVLAFGGKARIQPLPGFVRYKQMYSALQDIAKLVATMRYHPEWLCQKFH